MQNAEKASEASFPSSSQIASERGKVFGKGLLEYVAFQKVFLGVIAIVGIARLGLSVAGVPDAAVKWFSMTVVAAVGIFYYGVAVHISGFGGYKQLLPLLVIQNVLANSIVVGGIALAIAGFPNIFAAPEYSGPLYEHRQWAHILGHVVGGMGVYSVVGWGIASLVLLITKKLAPRPALA